MSQGASAILVHVCAAVQSAKALGEGESRSEGVVINEYALNQSHHFSSEKRLHKQEE